MKNLFFIKYKLFSDLEIRLPIIIMEINMNKQKKTKAQHISDLFLEVKKLFHFILLYIIIK